MNAKQRRLLTKANDKTFTPRKRRKKQNRRSFNSTIDLILKHNVFKSLRGNGDSFFFIFFWAWLLPVAAPFSVLDVSPVCVSVYYYCRTTTPANFNNVLDSLDYISFRAGLNHYLGSLWLPARVKQAENLNSAHFSVTLSNMLHTGIGTSASSSSSCNL